MGAKLESVRGAGSISALLLLGLGFLTSPVTGKYDLSHSEERAVIFCDTLYWGLQRAGQNTIL